MQLDAKGVRWPHTCFFSFAKPGKDECCFYGETMVATCIKIVLIHGREQD